MSCNCNVFEIIGSGGIEAAGLAVVSDNIIDGGGILGGVADVDTPGVYDQCSAVYPLDDVLSPWLDHSGNGLDLTAPTQGPNIAAGVFCLNSQSFDTTNREYLQATTDGTYQSFSVSFWLNLTNNHLPRVILSKGDSFKIYTSYLNHLAVTLFDTDDNETMLFSSTLLETERWYHVGISKDLQLQIYINGVLDNSTTIEGTIPTETINQIGAYKSKSFYQGYLQEVRFYPVAKSQAWFAAERSNLCGTLTTVGNKDTSVIYE